MDRIINLGTSWNFKFNYEVMLHNIQRDLRDYITSAGLKSLVLGISGGVDSALCAALAKPVCDELSIPLIGVSIPIQSNKLEEIQRARQIGKAFCTEFEEVDLGFTFQEISFKFGSIQVKDETPIMLKIRLGNLKARMRMMYLYNQAQANRGMVLSTDNYTEYLLGFWTLHGDVGDYGMIQSLWKTEVYGLNAFIAEKFPFKSIEKVSLMSCGLAIPTDGLGITDSDLDQLGAKTYREVDETLLYMLLEDNTQYTKLDCYQSIYNRHVNSTFKRNNPCNPSRFSLVSE